MCAWRAAPAASGLLHGRCRDHASPDAAHDGIPADVADGRPLDARAHVVRWRNRFRPFLRATPAMKTVAIEALLVAAVLITLLSVAGMLRMRDPYQRMHYISPPASLAALLIVAAIFLQRGLKPESFKALLTALVLIGMNT